MAAYRGSASGTVSTPSVKQNCYLRSHTNGAGFTLNCIAAAADSTIVCGHDQDQHRENDHRRRRRRPHPRGRRRPRRGRRRPRWRWRPVRPKNGFPLTIAPSSPCCGIVGRRSCAALIPRGGVCVLKREVPPSKVLLACRPVVTKRDQQRAGAAPLCTNLCRSSRRPSHLASYV